MTYTFAPIGIIRSPFKEKFGIPRQAGLIPEARASLELLPPYDQDEALRGLAGFSHVWIVFVFHGNVDRGWKPTVRPPRLGGKRRVGVFATRSNFRPNPIGLSAVKLDGFGRETGKLVLHLSGVDLLDGAPVLDIKPYLSYADSIPAAEGGFAARKPPASFDVIFAPEALAACRRREQAGASDLYHLIAQTLQTDPRPAYYATAPQKDRFNLRLFNFDIEWIVEGKQITVTEIRDVSESGAE